MKHTKDLQPIVQTSLKPALINTVAIKKDDNMLIDIHAKTKPSPTSIDDATLVMPFSTWLKVATILPLTYMFADFYTRFFIANPMYFDPFMVFPSFLLWLIWFVGVILIYRQSVRYFNKYSIDAHLFLLSYIFYFLPLSQLLGHRLFQSVPSLATECLFFTLLFVTSLAITLLLRSVLQREASATSIIIMFGVPAFIALTYGLIG